MPADLRGILSSLGLQSWDHYFFPVPIPDSSRIVWTAPPVLSCLLWAFYLICSLIISWLSASFCTVICYLITRLGWIGAFNETKLGFIISLLVKKINSIYKSIRCYNIEDLSVPRYFFKLIFVYTEIGLQPVLYGMPLTTPLGHQLGLDYSRVTVIFRYLKKYR